jgi:hypothetical protein
MGRNKQKIQHFFICVSVFRQQVICVLGAKSISEIKKYIKRIKNFNKNFIAGMDVIPNQDIRLGMTITLQGFAPVIIFPSYDKKNLENIANIVHEVSHAVTSLSEKLGLEKEEEARAYLTEFLFTQIKTELDKIT